MYFMAIFVNFLRDSEQLLRVSKQIFYELSNLFGILLYAKLPP